LPAGGELALEVRGVAGALDAATGADSCPTGDAQPRTSKAAAEHTSPNHERNDIVIKTPTECANRSGNF
jgi:hypothetical protein